MDAERISIAKACQEGAHDNSLSFPEFVDKLIAAGFEGYTVDYRRNAQAFYLPDGGSVVLEMHPYAGSVAANFDAVEVERLVRWAQANPADYSYVALREGEGGRLRGISRLVPRPTCRLFRAHRRDPCRALPQVTGRVVGRISDCLGLGTGCMRASLGAGAP